MTNIYQKSRIAPTNLMVKNNYYIMGDRYIQNILVTGLPGEFGLGMLSLYASNQNIKLFMVTERHRSNISKALRKELKEKRKKYNDSRDDTVRERLRIEIESLQIFIQETAQSRDKSHNVLMVYSVSASNKRDLDSEVEDFREQLMGEGFKTVIIHTLQLELMKHTTPVFSDADIPTVVKDNYGVVTPSTSIAGMFPYVFQTLKDPRGFVYGRELNQSGIVMLNPLLYVHDNKKAVFEKRLNNNITILGTSGSGKTTDSGLFVRFGIREKLGIVWIDPENKNFYMTKKFGGQFINWGSRNARINCWDLKPLSSEDGENIKAYDTELSMYNSINEFKILLSLYKDIKEDVLDMVDVVAIRMYQDHGINFDTDFRTFDNEDYPIQEDFTNAIDKVIKDYADDPTRQTDIDLLRDLERKTNSMITTDTYYFNGHTTIDRNKVRNGGILSFGTKNLFEKSLSLRNALNYLMFRFTWSICLDETIQSMFVLDEAHLMLLEGRSAEELATLYRRSRKYNNVSLIATQEPLDLNSDVLVGGVQMRVHGKAILNNSAYKMLKLMNKDAVQAISELMELNDSEIDRIKSFGQGDGLLCYGDRRILMTTLATEKELTEIKKGEG
ncbi:hypothetical protein PT160_07760 [Erysipelothrix rhusiopathiae]|nr:hypothetical protein [Erysipelothrix rhusiopathiae]MDE8269060.1 hypothetical protein [Erysipelothrix rhusiopathiae]MDE8270671.1 hypothetical protein [Erysipelothrix rhusiopathiae]MDE8279096.1 hypothetical protein [Erysipelothrix rhusiopathiae]MDE8319418.1 hypothetical protein [Erysipelothrix rhusiopathiae]